VPSATFTTTPTVCHSEPLNDGLWAIFNSCSRTKPVQVGISELRVDVAGGGNQTLDGSGSGMPTPGSLRVCRISTVTGGLAWTAAKHNSGSANLPSQVVVKTNADDYSSSDILRGHIDGLHYSRGQNSGDLIGMVRTSTARSRTRRSTGEIFGPGYGDSHIAPLVLLEGEGLAFVQQKFCYPIVLAFRIVLRNETTGACYAFMIKTMPSKQSTEALVAIMNGSGSGAAFSVREFEQVAIGEVFQSAVNNVSAWPIVRIVRTQTIRATYSGDPFAGAAIACNPHRSDRPLPAGIGVSRGPFQVLLPSRAGAGFLFPLWEIFETHATQPAQYASDRTLAVISDVQRRFMPSNICRDVGGANISGTASTRSDQRGYSDGIAMAWRKCQTEPLCLMPGEGLAICAIPGCWNIDTGEIDFCISTVLEISCTFFVKPVGAVQASEVVT
jgi:hypothetical protein